MATPGRFSARSLLAFGTQTIQSIRADALVRNSAYIMFTNISTSALGYVYWLIAARTFQDKEVGLVSTMIAAMNMASTLCLLGLNTALIQALAKRREKQEWSDTVNGALITGSAASFLGGLAAVVLLVSSPQLGTLINNPGFLSSFVLSVVFWTVATLLDAIFIAERAAGNMLVRNVSFSILKIIILIIFIPMNTGSFGIFFSWIFATALSIVLGFVQLVLLKPDYRFTIRRIIASSKSLVSVLAWHYLINIGNALPNYFLPVLVTIRLSPADNAYFYATWMICSPFFIISPAVSASLFAEGSHSPDALFVKVRSTIIILGVLLLPAMLGYVFLGKFILSIFGINYAIHGWILLIYLIIAAIPDAITNIYLSILKVQGELRRGAFLNIGMAAIAFVLAWILLPSLDIAGAGVAWLAGQLAGTVIVVSDFARLRQLAQDKSKTLININQEAQERTDQLIPDIGKSMGLLRVRASAWRLFQHSVQPFSQIHGSGPDSANMDNHVQILRKRKNLLYIIIVAIALLLIMLGFLILFIYTGGVEKASVQNSSVAPETVKFIRYEAQNPGATIVSNDNRLMDLPQSNAVLMVVSVLLLILISAKELLNHVETSVARRWNKLLMVCIVPLLLIFLVSVISRILAVAVQ